MRIGKLIQLTPRTLNSAILLIAVSSLAAVIVYLYTNSESAQKQRIQTLETQLTDCNKKLESLYSNITINLLMIEKKSKELEEKQKDINKKLGL